MEPSILLETSSGALAWRPSDERRNRAVRGRAARQSVAAGQLRRRQPGCSERGGFRRPCPAERGVADDAFRWRDAAHPRHRFADAGLGHEAAIAHLLDLGVTSVELLPVRSRCCSTSCSITPRKAITWARRCATAAWTTPRTTGWMATTRGSTSTRPAAATRLTLALR